MYFNARTRNCGSSGSILDRTTARNFLSINYGWKVGSTSRTSVTPTAARAFSCDGRDTPSRRRRFREDGHGYRRDDVQVVGVYGASVVGVSPELARVRQARNGAASSLEGGVFRAASSNRSRVVGEDERRAEIRAR